MVCMLGLQAKASQSWQIVAQPPRRNWDEESELSEIDKSGQDPEVEIDVAPLHV